MVHPVVSMTGFARTEGQEDGCSWTVEVKSVNGRNLDIRCRLPTGMESLEGIARTEIARRFKRGSLNVTLALTRTVSAGQFRINRPLLDQLLELSRELAGELCREPGETGASLPRLDALLAVRGVVEPIDDSEIANRDRLLSLLTADMIVTLDRLFVARAEEGTRLGDILAQQLEEISGLVVTATACAATQPAFLRERLRTQLATLLDALPSLSEERLAHEAALLVARGDIREELDRLRAHIAAARELFAAGEAVGRRLDFLCQEFNREANTLCSKSSDIELTRTGLALKAAIEQLREQVQNIE
ncbi:MAG: YicC/YloC family endoribonuclease [Rhodospirillaceae bacterium]